jgi:hypothetical protein
MPPHLNHFLAPSSSDASPVTPPLALFCPSLLSPFAACSSCPSSTSEWRCCSSWATWMRTAPSRSRGGSLARSTRRRCGRQRGALHSHIHVLPQPTVTLHASPRPHPSTPFTLNLPPSTLPPPRMSWWQLRWCLPACSPTCHPRRRWLCSQRWSSRRRARWSRSCPRRWPLPARTCRPWCKGPPPPRWSTASRWTCKSTCAASCTAGSCR